MISAEDLFNAYYECRRHKRRTTNALAFEMDFEKNLAELGREINAGAYRPRRSMAFILRSPVQREIFAADFRDRIVHHLLIGKINRLLEEYFIDDSFSCRAGKGGLAGVKRAAEMMRLCSRDYAADCHIMKLDLQAFFPSMDKRVLLDMLADFLNERYEGGDKGIVLELFRAVISSRPQEDCAIKGRRDDWHGLPPSKSLFSCGEGKGLPIGNLTSQVLANFYLTPLDKFVKEELGVEYYIRYVDDMLLFHPSKAFLLEAAARIKAFSWEKLKATVHPKKFYLQHYSKGVAFLGAFIKPGRIYIGRRTKRNLFDAMRKEGATREEFAASINSYMGCMVHFNTYKLRKKVLGEACGKCAGTYKKDNKVLKIQERMTERKRMERLIRKNRTRIDENSFQKYIDERFGKA